MKTSHVVRLTCRSSLIALTLLAAFLLPETQAEERSPVTPEPIVMWSGALADIPGGWQLCDGTNGTPDLRDRFIQGANNNIDLGEIGGSHAIRLSLSNLPSHTHSFSTTTDGAHSHQWWDRWGSESDNWPFGWGPSTCIEKGSKTQYHSTLNGGSHSHTGVTHPRGNSDPVENRPSYYHLAFITKTGSVAAIVPRCVTIPGSIVIWGGAIANIPAGWRLCNGKDGTPDLSDRFIVGSLEGIDPGGTGGRDMVTLTEGNLPSHGHPFRTDTAGDHDHYTNDGMVGHWALPESGNYGWFPWGYALSSYETHTLEPTEPAGEHSHTATTVGAGSGTAIDNRPAYRRLPFIISGTDDPRAIPIPTGAIAIWSNDISTIPPGWQMCDGTNGSPDLRDRFVLAGEVPGGTGGSDQIQLTAGSMPYHYHYLTTDVDGSHVHNIRDNWRPDTHFWQMWSVYDTGCGVLPFNEHARETETKGSPDCRHSHTGVADPVGGDVPYDNRPAYYKAAFIMRIS